jgi:hypothetical protein
MPRHHFDPLARGHLPHWITVADMWGVTVESSAVAPGSDLRQVLAQAISRLGLAGWHPENDGRLGFLFVSRGPSRMLVNLTAVDPNRAPDTGHAYLAGPGVVCHQ